MKAAFINGRLVPYPEYICQRLKTIETRQKDMLSALVGERIAIVETGRSRVPMVVGYADMVGKFFCSATDFDKYREQTMIPAGSAFDVKGSGKWCYMLENAEPCKPYPLPSSAIRHGRSWCEF